MDISDPPSAAKRPNPRHEEERWTARERFASVPTFRITVVNQTFRACNDHELPSFDDARKEGIKAALAIGANEVANGESYFGAEVLVEDGEKKLSRFVVSVGASSLQQPLPSRGR